MSLQEYIESGIIERYVLNLASPEEREEFERLSAKFPELIIARQEFEQALEEQAVAGSMTPPPHVKEKIFDRIRQEQMGKLASLPPTSVKKVSNMRWAVAASIILLAGCAALVWVFYTKNKEIQAEMAQVERTIDTLDKKQEDFDNRMLPKGAELKQVITRDHQPATIQVYWDSTSTDVYLVIRDLEVLPADKQYQVWSFQKGQPNSLGLFDAPADDRLILKMNNVQQADSFSITIVPKPQR